MRMLTLFELKDEMCFREQSFKKFPPTPYPTLTLPLEVAGLEKRME
jgi:hypothetical protein